MNEEALKAAVNGLLARRFSSFRDLFRGGEKTRPFWDKFLAQQRNLPQAHRLKNQVVRASKRGIHAIKQGNQQIVLKCYDEALEAMSQLSLLDLEFMPSLHFSLVNQAGQELVEFVVVNLFYSLVMEGKDVEVELPDPTELYVPLPAYLVGIIEGVSELSRMIGMRLVLMETGLDERIALRQRFAAFAWTVHEKLFDEFNDFPDNVVNGDGRRFFAQTLKGKLDHLRHMTEAHTRAIGDMFDRVATR